MTVLLAAVWLRGTGSAVSQFDEELKIEYGVVTVSYGTKQGTDSLRDMVIGPDEYRKIGLDYPTRFSMDRIEEFVWCKEWFPSRRYFANQIVYFGCLRQHQIARFTECLSRFRGS
jgi:hypothetical protein